MNRPFLFALLCFLAVPAAQCQKIERYFDYAWHDTTAASARFYRLIERVDSGWRCRNYYLHNLTLETEGLYQDSACLVPSGWYHSWHPTRILASEGLLRNGLKQGIWLQYYSDGQLSDSTVWEKGSPMGISMSWYRNGWPKDSCYYAADGSGMQLSWFDNGQPLAAGRFGPGRKKTGRWTYFNRSGERSALEIYDVQGSLFQRQYFNERGGIISDTSSHTRPAQFPGGSAGWERYLEQNIYFPVQVVPARGDAPIVVVSATIDEEGRVVDAEVSTPFYPAWDKIALELVSHSPVWAPAMDHNRRVPERISTVVRFARSK